MIAFFFQIMSVYYDEEAKADAAAEGFLQRAEQRVLVHNHYTYDAVARVKGNEKLRGKNIDIYIYFY